MNRLLSLLAILLLLACVRPSVAADRDTAKETYGTHPVIANVQLEDCKNNICIDAKGPFGNELTYNCKPPQSQGPTVTVAPPFVPEPQDSFPLVPVLIGVGVVAAGIGIAVQWNSIAKTVTPVH